MSTLLKNEQFSNLPIDKIQGIQLIISDFDGVFTDNYVWINELGEETVKCSRADGIGISNLARRNIKVIVCSSEANEVVTKRCLKLNIECYQNIKNKGDFINNYLSNQMYNKENIIYIGNDINDIPALPHIGISVGVKDSHIDYLQMCDYILNVNGGKGAIRNLADIICKKKDEYNRNTK